MLGSMLEPARPDEHYDMAFGLRCGSHWPLGQSLPDREGHDLPATRVDPIVGCRCRGPQAQGTSGGAGLGALEVSVSSLSVSPTRPA